MARGDPWIKAKCGYVNCGKEFEVMPAYYRSRIAKSKSGEIFCCPKCSENANTLRTTGAKQLKDDICKEREWWVGDSQEYEHMTWAKDLAAVKSELSLAPDAVFFKVGPIPSYSEIEASWADRCAYLLSMLDLISNYGKLDGTLSEAHSKLKDCIHIAEEAKKQHAEFLKQMIEELKPFSRGTVAS